MSFYVVSVRTKKELETFVRLPFAIHGQHPLWVPPLVKDDLALLTPGKHPFWETARRELFLVFRDGRPVGRVAAIVDEKSNAYWNEKCGSFGFFECENDPEAAVAMLRTAAGWLKSEGMEFMRGPLNPSTNYTCGLLVGGYDVPPAIMMPWNPPYYLDLLNAFHMRKEQDLFAYHIGRESSSLPPRLAEELERLKKKGEFEVRRSGKRTLAEDVRVMLDLYAESWARNFAFSPLSESEARAQVKELVAYLDPAYFVLFFHRGEPAGGMVALPDYTSLLKRLNGRLGLLAPWHYLASRRDTRKSCRIMLFGIREKYRLLGLPLLLFDYMLEQAKARPELEWVEGSWVLEDNAAVDDLIEDFGGVLRKRYRLLRRDLV